MTFNVNVNEAHFNDAVQITNSNLLLLKDWFDYNELSMNPSKTKVIHFKYMNTELNNKRKKELLQNNIDVANYVNFLGVAINENLNWSEHIKLTCKKLTKATYAIRSLKRKTTFEAAKVAYFSYFQSILSYDIIFWGNAAGCYIHRLFVIQKLTLRALLGLPARTECKKYFFDTKILKLPCLYILEVLMFIKKNMHLFSHHVFDHSYSTRNKNCFKLTKYKSTNFNNSVYITGLKLYNKLSSELINEC
jgi:hypothetical protein